ncbi:MAG: RecT family recombinase [Sphingobium sp.]
MNDTNNELSVIESNTIGSTAMMFGSGNLERAMQVADAMASAKVSVPNHLRGQPGDCLAIVMQATQWGMNPFAVAQKTHLVSGTLGYEAQLVNAVIQNSGAIKGRFHYEYKGEGDQMECRVGAIIAGENDITWGEWLASRHVTTKNSPLWKTNPKQQLGYLQIKNWSRAFCPGAILGVYTVDELNDAPPRDMGSIDRETGDVTKPGEPETPALPPCPDTKIDRWIANVKAGAAAADELLAFAQGRYTLTADQIKRINDFVAETKNPPIDAEFTAAYEGAEQL